MEEHPRYFKVFSDGTVVFRGKPDRVIFHEGLTYAYHYANHWPQRNLPQVIQRLDLDPDLTYIVGHSSACHMSINKLLECIERKAFRDTFNRGDTSNANTAD